MRCIHCHELIVFSMFYGVFHHSNDGVTTCSGRNTVATVRETKARSFA